MGGKKSNLKIAIYILDVILFFQIITLEKSFSIFSSSRFSFFFFFPPSFFVSYLSSLIYQLVMLPCLSSTPRAFEVASVRGFITLSPPSPFPSPFPFHLPFQPSQPLGPITPLDLSATHPQPLRFIHPQGHAPQPPQPPQPSQPPLLV